MSQGNRLAHDDRRNRKIEARRLMAASLQGQMQVVAMYSFNFVHRSFLKRLRWLLFGEPMPTQHRHPHASIAMAPNGNL